MTPKYKKHQGYIPISQRGAEKERKFTAQNKKMSCRIILDLILKV